MTLFFDCLLVERNESFSTPELHRAQKGTHCLPLFGIAKTAKAAPMPMFVTAEACHLSESQEDEQWLWSHWMHAQVNNERICLARVVHCETKPEKFSMDPPSTGARSM